jgi:hypothetical protein
MSYRVAEERIGAGSVLLGDVRLSIGGYSDLDGSWLRKSSGAAFGRSSMIDCFLSPLCSANAAIFAASKRHCLLTALEYRIRLEKL